jgi:hypothetical protein
VLGMRRPQLRRLEARKNEEVDPHTRVSSFAGTRFVERPYFPARPKQRLAALSYHDQLLFMIKYWVRAAPLTRLRPPPGPAGPPPLAPGGAALPRARRA